MSISSCHDCVNFGKSEVGGVAIGNCSAIEQTVFIGGVSPMGHLTRLAESCSHKDTSPAAPQPRWSRATAKKNAPPAFTGQSLDTCRACKFYAPSELTGQPVNICSATGSVVSNTTEDCKGCPFSDLGPTDTARVKGMTLHPIIRDASFIRVPEEVSIAASAKRSRSSKKSSFDPITYPTDKPVEAHHKGIIRAWRAVKVGEGDKRVEEFLPIFEPEYFSEGERALIPKSGSDERPELYHDGSKIEETFTIESWINDEPLCFVGEPGAGKTEAARWLAWRLQVPFHWLQITEETLPDEFLGGKEALDGTTFFREGRLPTAIKRPGLVLSDEYNTGPDSIRQTYRSLNSRSATIFLEGADKADQVVVKRHEFCFHLLSLNPVWDARNLGTRELADADVSRLSFCWVEEPNEKIIASIIVSSLEAEGLTVSDDELAGMLKVRKDLKELSASGALPFSWTIRQDVKVARKLVFYTATTAYKRALLDYVDPRAAEAAIKAVQSVFGR